MGHSGVVESLAWDPVHRRLASAAGGLLHLWNLTPDKTLTTIASQPEKQSYIACTVHFYDNGASLLVSYLESGEISKVVQEGARNGNAVLKGSFLLMSNLKDGVDKYTIPTLQHVQSYNHVILHNVPLQISVAQQAGLIFVGGDDGFARVFDYSTGTYRGQLAHGNWGDQIIPIICMKGGLGALLLLAAALMGIVA
ncbi:uncharacterized protein EDB91DRAFT_1254097 [Suillus paluster]|uniref:uncharacterized protein n=1 Tax=Suillus paluster TaxID=48578 RepID=UPI001B8647D7|nr:uncharacterized protein EDB91DRAFT_1254097 [Suillus paluster]KAG1726982.1 hypothetical protein EDB91DRAFT_1254097 [Suillus paluster]